MDNRLWRRIAFFISSTFKDMDTERDILKTNVLRRLNEHFRKYKIDFQFIDLRIGINTEGITEEESEEQVLDICFESIDHARPYFIGLVGNRYGWIPSEERWRTFLQRMSEEKRILITDGYGKSVTELEILYGAIGNNGKYINHSFFFFRNEDSYAGMPLETYVKYSDCQDKDTYSPQKKLQALKEIIQRVSTDVSKHIQINRYTLHWDVEKECFIDGETFADMAYEQIASEIEKNLPSLSISSWQEQETDLCNYLIHSYTDGKIRTESCDEVLLSSFTNNHLCIVGNVGEGKSTLLAQLMLYYSSIKEDTICLYAYAGVSIYSKSINPILIRWINQIEEYLGKNISDFTVDENNKEVLKYFKKIAKESTERGIKIIVLLDNIDVLKNMRYDDLYLAWLCDDVSFIGTATPQIGAIIKQYHPQMAITTIKNLSVDDKKHIVFAYEQYYNIALPTAIHQMVYEENIYPLRLSLLMTIIANFTAYNMKMIRNSTASTEIEKINNHIISIAQILPTEPMELFQYTVDRLILQLGLSQSYKKALMYIALSGIGLCEDELETLLPGTLNFTRFRDFAYILRDFLCEHIHTHRWFFKDCSFADALKKFNTKENYSSLLDVALSQTPDYPLRKYLAPYFAIKSHRVSDIIELVQYHYEDDFYMYETARFYIISDYAIVSDIKECCQSLYPKQIVLFIANLIRGINHTNNPQLCLNIVEQCLLGKQFEGLQAEVLYELASIYVNCHFCCTNNLVNKLFHNRYFYDDLAENAFRRCYELAPETRDVRNMLKAIMLEHIDRFSTEKNWDKIEEYYSLINKL